MIGLHEPHCLPYRQRSRLLLGDRDDSLRRLPLNAETGARTPMRVCCFLNWDRLRHFVVDADSLLVLRRNICSDADLARHAEEVSIPSTSDVRDVVDVDRSCGD